MRDGITAILWTVPFGTRRMMIFGSFGNGTSPVSPFSFGWWAVVGDDHAHNGAALPRGALIRYREWYGKGEKLTADVVGRGLVEREIGDPKLSYGALDPSAFKEDGGPSIAERINDQLIAKKLVPFSAADNTRIPRQGAVGGWDQMRSRLVGKDGAPMIYCFSTCADSIRTIPTLQHDPNRAEDVNTESEDHAADEWRYACMSRPWIKEKPVAEEKSKNTWGYRPIDLGENLADWKTY
jgi:hypothetical protein